MKMRTVLALVVLTLGAILALPTGAVAQGVLYVTGGNVGIGTSTPSTALHLSGDLGSSRLLIENGNAAAAQRLLVEVANNGGAGFKFVDNNNGVEWKFAALNGGNFEVTKIGSGGALFRFDQSGNLNVLQGVVVEGSSRELKEEFEAVDTEDVLNKVLELPIQEWSYKDQQARHLGPVAEDFHEQFGLGDTTKGIASLDSGGVALGAIQGLNEKLEAENERLWNEIQELKALVHELSGE